MLASLPQGALTIVGLLIATLPLWAVLGALVCQLALDGVPVSSDEKATVLGTKTTEIGDLGCARAGGIGRPRSCDPMSSE